MVDELRYHPDADQLALAQTLVPSLEALLPLARLHASRQESDATWPQLESLGLFAIGIDEDRGGIGLGATEEALVAMELGRRLASPSVLASMGAAHGRPAADAAEACPGARTAAAWQRGERTIIVADPGASAVLVRDGAHASLHANDMASVALDDQLWHAALLESPRPRTAPLAVFDAAAVLRLTLIDAAALAGIAEQALEMAVAHAVERRQFGRAIGSFQAVKHHCANMAIAARLARDQVGFAAIAIDDARDDAALQVDCALLVAGNAALGNAATSIQVHGGMGFSDETHPHLLLKRARLQLAIAGGLEAATARIADASGRGDATAGGQEAAGHAR